jgi:hypothetical protein
LGISHDLFRIYAASAAEGATRRLKMKSMTRHSIPRYIGENMPLACRSQAG